MQDVIQQLTNMSSATQIPSQGQQGWVYHRSAIWQHVLAEALTLGDRRAAAWPAAAAG